MTKLSDLPVGAKIKDVDTKYNGNVIIWKIADKNHSGYPSNSVTLISENVLDKRAYETTSTYKDSRLRIWLNSSSGFLSGFSQDLKQFLLQTQLRANDTDSLATDKVFLASFQEFYNSDGHGGSKLALFKDKNSQVARDLNGRVSEWWLRDNYYGESMWFANVDGERLVDDAREEKGIRPLCNVKSDIKVSSSTDSSGVYTITFNTPPTIDSYTSSYMGQKSKEFSISYSVIDEDYGQSLTVEEYLDNRRTRSFSVRSGSSYSFSLSKSEFQKLSNGNHTIKIKARDSEGGVGEKVFDFSKNETKILFTLKKPLVADAMVTRALINVIGSIPDKATLKVEACNNGNDPNPTWEDCTGQALAQNKIFLRNNQKTASQWGFNVRVSLDRNGATGECYISSIGGNFE